MTNVGIILAGGSGTRMGASIPKQFIEVLGKPIIAYTIELYQNHPEIDAIEIVCIEEYVERLKSIVDEFSFSKVQWICVGGSDFQHSVISGINNLSESLSSEDIVLVHYAVAPFTSNDIISDSIKVSKLKGNSVSANPCLYLVGTNEGDRSCKWIDRDKLMILNGPQGFQYGYIKSIYDRAIKNNYLDKVEPHTTSLMFYMGETLYFAKGNQTNIKITTKEDLLLFEGFLLANKNHQKSE